MAMNLDGSDTAVSSAPAAPSPVEAVLSGLQAATRQNRRPSDIDDDGAPDAPFDILRPYVEEDQLPVVEWVLFGLPAYQADAASWPASVITQLLPRCGALGDFLEHLPPGERLGKVLGAIDPEQVDDFSLVEVVAAHKRMESFAAAQAARAAAVLAERDAVNPTWPSTVPGRTRGECVVGQELSMRLRISKQAGIRIVACGRAFGGMFRPTGEALELGLIDFPRAQAIVSTLLDLPAEVAMAAQWEVLDKAPGRTLRQVQQDLAKAVIAVDPDSADDRHRVARKKRCVNRPRPLPDGMALLSAVLPAADAIALETALEAAARAAKNAGDQRTLDQLRADCLALMGHTALELGHIGPHPHVSCACGCLRQGDASPPAADAAPTSVPPEPHPAAPPSSAGSAFRPPDGTAQPRPRPADGPPHPGHRLQGCALPMIRLGMLGGGRSDIRITIPINVLLPGDRDPDVTALDRDAEPVAELEGYGPVPPVVARALSAGGDWRRIVTDPTGTTILDVGRTRYQPPADIAEHVRERDGSCIRPGCSCAARTSDLDHIHEWQDGGVTSASNLGPLCGGDHRAKSIGAFTVAYASDRTYAWTTPTGHGYLRRPDGTVVTLPRRTAEGLRALTKATARDGRPVDPAVVDAALATISAGSEVSGSWAPRGGAPATPWPVVEPPTWAGDEPPF